MLWHSRMNPLMAVRGLVILWLGAIRGVGLSREIPPGPAQLLGHKRREKRPFGPWVPLAVGWLPPVRGVTIMKALARGISGAALAEKVFCLQPWTVLRHLKRGRAHV